MTKQWTATHWNAALHGYVPGLLLGMCTVGAATSSGLLGSLMVGISAFIALVISKNAEGGQ